MMQQQRQRPPSRPSKKPKRRNSLLDSVLIHNVGEAIRVQDGVLVDLVVQEDHHATTRTPATASISMEDDFCTDNEDECYYYDNDDYRFDNQKLTKRLSHDDDDEEDDTLSYIKKDNKTTKVDSKLGLYGGQQQQQQQQSSSAENDDSYMEDTTETTASETEISSTDNNASEDDLLCSWESVALCKNKDIQKLLKLYWTLLYGPNFQQQKQRQQQIIVGGAGVASATLLPTKSCLSKKCQLHNDDSGGGAEDDAFDPYASPPRSFRHQQQDEGKEEEEENHPPVTKTDTKVQFSCSSAVEYHQDDPVLTNYLFPIPNAEEKYPVTAAVQLRNHHQNYLLQCPSYQSNNDDEVESHEEEDMLEGSMDWSNLSNDNDCYGSSQRRNNRRENFGDYLRKSGQEDSFRLESSKDDDGDLFPESFRIGSSSSLLSSLRMDSNSSLQFGSSQLLRGSNGMLDSSLSRGMDSSKAVDEARDHHLETVNEEKNLASCSSLGGEEEVQQEQQSVVQNAQASSSSLFEQFVQDPETNVVCLDNNADGSMMHLQELIRHDTAMQLPVKDDDGDEKEDSKKQDLDTVLELCAASPCLRTLFSDQVQKMNNHLELTNGEEPLQQQQQQRSVEEAPQHVRDKLAEWAQYQWDKLETKALEQIQLDMDQVQNELDQAHASLDEALALDPQQEQQHVVVGKEVILRVHLQACHELESQILKEEQLHLEQERYMNLIRMHLDAFRESLRHAAICHLLPFTNGDDDDDPSDGTGIRLVYNMLVEGMALSVTCRLDGLVVGAISEMKILPSRTHRRPMEIPESHVAAIFYKTLLDSGTMLLFGRSNGDDDDDSSDPSDLLLLATFMGRLELATMDIFRASEAYAISVLGDVSSKSFTLSISVSDGKSIEVIYDLTDSQLVFSSLPLDIQVVTDGGGSSSTNNHESIGEVLDNMRGPSTSSTLLSLVCAYVAAIET